MKKINIAIDGPSGVGKSTIADIVAEKLNMRHLDTGAMYRCVAYKTLKDGVNIQDEKAMSDLMDTIDIHFDEDNHVYLDGEDVSKEIRMNNVSMQASKTSQLGIVRKKLVNLQQKVCANKGFIVDGRDICSVVLHRVRLEPKEDMMNIFQRELMLIMKRSIRILSQETIRICIVKFRL